MAFNFNISSFFGNTKSDNLFNSFNFGDYASIKNGSYAKLTKSYYAKDKPEKAEKASSTNKTKKEKEVVDKSGLSQMKKEADGLKSSVEALGKDDLWKQTAGEYDKDKILSAVKSFTKDYNDVIDQSNKTDSKDVSQNMHYMKSMTSTMTKALSQIGVNVGSDGKLSVDEEKLKSANVNTVKNMFSGAGSYGSQIANKAADVAKATQNISLYSSDGTFESSLSNMFNSWM